MELRAASGADAPACLAVQRRSTIKGYAQIFPQDEYPVPEDIVRAEWVARLAGPSQVVVGIVDREIVGTVAARAPRLEARRFYERRGWVLDGRTERLPFPPYPILVGYRRDLGNVDEASPHASIDV